MVTGSMTFKGVSGAPPDESKSLSGLHSDTRHDGARVVVQNSSSRSQRPEIVCQLKGQANKISRLKISGFAIFSQF